MKSDQYEPTSDEKRIVEWLRKSGETMVRLSIHDDNTLFPGLALRGEGRIVAADAIERGEHREGEQ